MNNLQPPTFKIPPHPRKHLFSLLLWGIMGLFAACGGADPSHNQSVASVNGEKISLAEYQEFLKSRKGILSPKNYQNSSIMKKVLEEEILESLITEKILLLRARELKIRVSDDELERKLIDIRKDYGDNFFDLLARQNVQYERWQDQVRKEMLLEKLVKADVNQSIRVSEDEAEDYYAEHPELHKTAASVRASQIVVRDAETAREVKKRLDNGESFAQVAAQTSIGPEAVRGGDLGLISRGMMPEPMDQTLFKLPTGKISPIVKSSYGHHILMVTEIHPAGARSFLDCREEIIQDLRRRKEDAAFHIWLDGLRMKAVIKKNLNIIRDKQP